MLFRALGIIVCFCIIALGMMFLQAGHFGGYLTGGAITLFGAVILIFNIWDLWEQKANQPKGGTPDGFLADGTIIEIKTAQSCGLYGEVLPQSVEYDWQRHARERQEFIDHNTPDPNLIHPDDLKRTKLIDADCEAERRLLDIKV